MVGGKVGGRVTKLHVKLYKSLNKSVRGGGVGWDCFSDIAKHAVAPSSSATKAFGIGPFPLVKCTVKSLIK